MRGRTHHVRPRAQYSSVSSPPIFVRGSHRTYSEPTLWQQTNRPGGRVTFARYRVFPIRAHQAASRMRRQSPGVSRLGLARAPGSLAAISANRSNRDGSIPISRREVGMPMAQAKTPNSVLKLGSGVAFANASAMVAYRS